MGRSFRQEICAKCQGGKADETRWIVAKQCRHAWEWRRHKLTIYDDLNAIDFPCPYGLPIRAEAAQQRPPEILYQQGPCRKQGKTVRSGCCLRNTFVECLHWPETLTVSLQQCVDCLFWEPVMAGYMLVRWNRWAQYVDEDGMAHTRHAGDEDIIPVKQARSLSAAGQLKIIGDVDATDRQVAGVS